MPDVVALGELLIDFVPTKSGVSLTEAPAFEKAPGGAPANVAVGLARLGKSSAFLGKVGADAFGYFLAQTLADNGVDVRGIRFDYQARTALAFVTLRADGEREFMFYRHPSADMRYSESDVDQAVISQARIFHHGSISLIDEPSRSATYLAIGTAVANGVRISFDPNLRLALWPNDDMARQQILAVMPHANVLKIAAEELVFLTGIDDLEAGMRSLWHDRLEIAVVTQGAQGCRYFTTQVSGHVPGFNVKAIDATGAGDAFVAGLLYGLLQPQYRLESDREVRQICRFANAAGALTTTRRGAIPALPTIQEIQHLIAQGQIA